MEKIRAKQFNMTKDFLYQNCRELEIARFEFLFGNGSKENVMEKLKSFQNADGGFGHGIEPDFWLPKSSPMATWAGGQVLLEIKAKKDDLIVEQMLSFLVSTYNEETGKWASVIPAFNDYPHAPWWHWEEGAEESWSFNPSVELAAFLVHWSDPETRSAQIGWRSIEKAVTYLMNQTEMDKHEINNFQAFIKIIEPHKSTLKTETGYSYRGVLEKIADLAYKCINKDVSSWDSGYVPLPLDFIDNPESPLCDKLGSLVVENLKFYRMQMSEEGVWDISWGWGSHPEEFEKARIYWKGILAVERYKKLKAFGYVE
ncbi:hypothetical protein [Paucisalibacillus sp. EB02]|uniref:hypothetical protein n=1 Tax=Paucisalibacillus sp. EB02 TaxID=1347087 RepID=UPI0004BC7BE3|nr:hypothetical protein [Paucisalibacillus sp. EB02]